MGGAAGHVVAVVGPVVVVVGEPGVGLGLELVSADEEAPVEGGPPALVEHGLVEAFHDGVVVGGPGRDAAVLDAEAGQVVSEGVGDELGSVVRQDCGDGVAAVGPAAADEVDEADGGLGGGSPGGDPGVGDAGVGVDCGELPDLADAFEFCRCRSSPGLLTPQGTPPTGRTRRVRLAPPARRGWRR